MSVMSVDLPLPLTPVTTVMVPRGKAASMSLRLCSVAPSMTMDLPEPERRTEGTGMERVPFMYCPVREAGVFSTWRGVPAATRWPPRRPAPGPRSMT
jgi:hypothetical protein